MKAILAILLVQMLCPASALAQGDEPKHLRFLALGELWTWDEKLKKGIREGQKPPDGAMPPEELSLASGDKLIPFKLNYSIFTELITLKPAAKGLEIKSGKAPESPSWLRSRKPAAPLSLGVLFTDPATMMWPNPKMLLLKDDEDAFSAGQMRFVNVSDRVIYVQMGEKKAGKRPLYFGVAAGRSSIKPVAVGSTFIKVTGNDPSREGTEELIFQSAIRVMAGQRVQSFFYKARPVKGVSGIMHYHLVEPVPKLPAKPKDGK